MIRVKVLSSLKVRVHWLFGVATAMALVGGSFGYCGFTGWTTYSPGWLIALLG